jgi:transposase-like protein
MTETESKWAERVRERKASGKSFEEFAEGRDFKASSLRYWDITLRHGAPSERRSAATPPQIRLAKVVASSTLQPASIEVAIGAARVLVRAGFDRALLRQVVDALGAGS